MRPCTADETSLILLMAFVVDCVNRNVRKYRFEAEIVILLIIIPHIYFQYINVILKFWCFTKYLTDEGDYLNIYIVVVDNMLPPDLHLLKTGNALKSNFCCQDSSEIAQVIAIIIILFSTKHNFHIELWNQITFEGNHHVKFRCCFFIGGYYWFYFSWFSWKSDVLTNIKCPSV